LFPNAPACYDYYFSKIYGPLKDFLAEIRDSTITPDYKEIWRKFQTLVVNKQLKKGCLQSPKE
jgi:hypothetical protein